MHRFKLSFIPWIRTRCLAPLAMALVFSCTCNLAMGKVFLQEAEYIEDTPPVQDEAKSSKLKREKNPSQKSKSKDRPTGDQSVTETQAVEPDSPAQPAEIGAPPPVEPSETSPDAPKAAEPVMDTTLEAPTDGSAVHSTSPTDSELPQISPYQQLVDDLSAKAAALAHDDGDGKLSLATECEHTADALALQAAFVESKQCYQLAHQLRVEVVGESDFTIVPALIGKAKCNWSLELHEESISDYKHALVIVDASNPQAGDDKWLAQEKILRGLVACYLFLKNPDEALLYGKRAHALAATAFGSDSSQTLWSAAQLSETMRVAGMKGQSAVFNREMFEICLKRAGGKKYAIKGASPVSETTAAGPNESLPIRFWPCRGSQLRAILLCVPGMCLHAGSYESFANSMAGKGFAVVAVDVRGLGSWMQSQGQEYLNLSACLSDISFISEELNNLHPEIPIFLVGESMGAGLALHAASQEGKRFAGLITSVPGSHRFQQGKQTLRVALQMTRGLDSYFDISKDLLKNATSNDSLRQHWNADPMTKRYLSPRELIGFQTLMDANVKKARSINLLPVLVMQGMNDRFVKPQSTEKVFAAISSADKTLMRFNDREHLILELSQFTPEILEKLTKWLEQRIGVLSHLTNNQMESGAQLAVVKRN